MEKREIELELIRIQCWFRQNDWKPNKIVTGEWQTNDPRWVEYLSERLVKRNRQDELKALLESYEANN